MSHLEPTTGKRITAAELARLPDIVDDLAKQGLCLQKTQIFSEGDGAYLELAKVVPDENDHAPPPPPKEPEKEQEPAPTPEPDEDEPEEAKPTSPLEKLTRVSKFKRGKK